MTFLSQQKSADIPMNAEAIEFNGIYKEYYAKLFRYLARFVGESEAEDLTQEVFVKIHKALDNFRGDSKLSSWIYRIATNTAYDRLSSPSFQRLDIEDLSESSGEEKNIHADDINIWTGAKMTSIDQHIVHNEMNDCIREFIENLHANYKSVLILSEFEGLKNKEIAEILNVSLDTVKIRIHRARTRLKKELEKGCDFYHNDNNALACDKKK